MNDAPRRTLRELIERHGPGLCGDARRCEGLLRDLCGEHRREINILVGALREHVPLDLLAARNSLPAGLLLTRLAKRLEEGQALTAEASRWGVDSWALALGVVTEAELAEASRRREAAVREAAAGSALANASVGRPAAEGVEAQRNPAPSSAPRPPAAPPNPPAPRPAATGRPHAAGPKGPPLAGPARTQTPARGRSAATAPPQKPSAATPAPPQPGGPGGTRTADPYTRPGRGWRRSGCAVGCVLLLLLLAALAGAPFVINLLREEQLQRSPPAAPGRTN